MPGGNHLGHAYPFINRQLDSLPVDQAIADIDLLIYSSAFDPSIHDIVVTSITQNSIDILISVIRDTPFTCTLTDNSWASTDHGIISVRVLAGPPQFRQVPWTGGAIVEPCRSIVIPGANQSVEVYNKQRTRVPQKEGCIPPEFASEVDGDYALLCGPYSGNVFLGGGHNSRVFQYVASQELQLFGDSLGGELGSPCSGQESYYDQDISPRGRNTLDGAPRCSDVLRSINGVSEDAFRIGSGDGVSVFPQPAKSRITIRIDGAGSAICPYPEIDQADCPANDDPYCGPVGGFDNCPDPPESLGSLRLPGTIPPVASLPIAGGGSNTRECVTLPSRLKYLALRGCSSASAKFDGNVWEYARRCSPSCLGSLPTSTPAPGTIQPVNCSFVPPDPTIGIRNPEFTNFDHWGLVQSPTAIVTHPAFPREAMPAVSLTGIQAVYQTEIYVAHRSVLSFQYLGKLRLYIVTSNKLCVDEALDSEGVVATYVGDFVIRTNQEVAIQLQAEDPSAEVVVSLPFLTAVS